MEVIQEGMSYPQPSEEETKEAVKELVNELNVMDQATQTPPQPTLEEIFNSKVKLTELFDSPEAFAKAMNGEKKVNTPKFQIPPPEGDIEPFTRMVNLANMLRTPAEDYMVCPHHRVRLEERVSQNGWECVKCPIYPCLLFCAKEKALDYKKEAHYQPHADVRRMWSCLLCFCREPPRFNRATLQTSPEGCF